ncbi:hypothetical protein ACP4OV_024447 [Aristida adscensionis]
MSSIESKESFGSLGSYHTDDDDLDQLEALTLSSKQIKEAREQALKILNTKSPEEAPTIFTEVLQATTRAVSEVKVGDPGENKAPKAADVKPGATVQPPPQPSKN